MHQMAVTLDLAIEGSISIIKTYPRLILREFRAPKLAMIKHVTNRFLEQSKPT